jgi:F-box protein 18 (helicase)
MSVTPTQEQSIISKTHLSPGSVMLVNAYAGTGKTETLRLIAEANPGRRLLYLSFNRQTALQAKKRFPENTDCRTIHSLAFQTTGKKFKDKLGMPTPQKVLQLLGVEKPYIAVLALEAIKEYCYSVDRFLTEEHIDKKILKKYPEVLPLAKKIWREMQDLNSSLCMSHDGYLKLWSLNAPRISADIILLDEAQDTNPVTLKILMDQCDYGSCSLVLVGDSHQAIYAWRKAVNAMEIAREVADHVHPLTESFRFNQTIATNASKILNHYKGDPVHLKGLGPSNSSLPKSVIIGRRNGSLLSRAIPVVERGGTVHFAGTNERDKWDPYYLYELQIPLDIVYLKMDQKELVETPQIRLFNDYQEIVDLIKGDGEGAGIDKELEKHVKLVDEYGDQLPDLIDKLRRFCRSPDVAQISLSTAHRAKGLEWRSVEMLDDFASLQTERESDPFDREYLEEINLIYVAMTRASDSVSYPTDLSAWLDSH